MLVLYAFLVPIFFNKLDGTRPDGFFDVLWLISTDSSDSASCF